MKLVDEIKFIKGFAGIYMIQNDINGKVYIGSGKCLHRRFADHNNCLVNYMHWNENLNLDVIEYGVESFSFIVLESFDYYDRKELKRLEQFYMNKYQNPYNKNKSHKFNESEGRPIKVRKWVSTGQDILSERPTLPDGLYEYAAFNVTTGKYKMVKAMGKVTYPKL